MVRVYLTGGLTVEGPAGVFVESELPGTQSRVALTVLVVERRPMSRDELAELVWDDDMPPQWNGALHTIISKLRALVSAIGLDGRQTLATVGSSYVLNLPPDSWVDLEDAFARLDRAEGALRHDDPMTATAEATVAWSILRRPLLAGVDGLWVDRQRRHQRAAAYRCATALAEGWLRRGDHRLAAVVAESAVALDPLREVGYQLLARAEWGRGDRAAALRVLDRCERMVADELGVGPAPETARLSVQFRS